MSKRKREPTDAQSRIVVLANRGMSVDEISIEINKPKSFIRQALSAIDLGIAEDAFFDCSVLEMRARYSKIDTESHPLLSKARRLARAICEASSNDAELMALDLIEAIDKHLRRELKPTPPPGAIES